MGREECEESLLNKNVNWIHSSPFWVFYGLLILFFRLWMPFFVPERHAWTGTNVVHGIVRTSEKLNVYIYINTYRYRL